MSSIKQKIIQTIKDVSYTSGLSPRFTKRTKAARILMFHGIGDHNHSKALFEKQINFVNKHFNVVSLDHLLDKMAAGEPLTDELVLTFDDGLRNNATHAYSVLKKHDTPATFYVCPGLIESGRWMWNHEARERLHSIPASTQAEFAATWGCENDIEDMITWMKGLSVVERTKIEDNIRTESKTFKPSDDQKNAFDMMNWRELKGLDENLITIGSHTTNHIIAKDLTADVMHTELAGSKCMLEEQLGRNVNHFCYPNGDFDDATVQGVKKVYASAMTTQEGLVSSNDNRFLLNRIPSATSLSYFASSVFRSNWSVIPEIKDHSIHSTPERS